MRVPLIASLLLHAAVAVGLTVGAPDFGEPMQAEQPVPVEVVSEKELARKLGETPAEPQDTETSEPEPETQPEETAAEAEEPEPETTAEAPAEDRGDSAPEIPESGRQAEPEPEQVPAPEQRQAEASEPEAEPESAQSAPPIPDQRPDKPEPVTTASQTEPEPEPVPEEPEPEPEPDPEADQATPSQPPEKPRVQMADTADAESESNLDSILKDVEQSYSGGSQPDTATAEAERAADAESAEPAADETSDRVTAGQRQAIRDEIADNWNVPAGARDAEDLVVKLRVTFNQDRSVASVEILNDARMDDSFFSAAARSAARAVHIASPLESLPPDAFSTWRVMELTFDPKEMLDS